jgi:hypothetical protein
MQLSYLDPDVLHLGAWRGSPYHFSQVDRPTYGLVCCLRAESVLQAIIATTKLTAFARVDTRRRPDNFSSECLQFIELLPHRSRARIDKFRGLQRQFSDFDLSAHPSGAR